MSTTHAAPKAAPAKAKPESASGPDTEKPETEKPSARSSTPASKSPSEIYSGIPGDAKGTIVFAVILTSGSALLAQAIHKKSASPRPYIRIILAGFLMGLGLTAVSQVNANVAKALAWVTALSALLLNGAALFGVAGDVVTNTKNPGTQASPSSGGGGSNGLFGGTLAPGSLGKAVGGAVNTIQGIVNPPKATPPHVSEHGG